MQAKQWIGPVLGITDRAVGGDYIGDGRLFSGYGGVKEGQQGVVAVSAARACSILLAKAL